MRSLILLSWLSLTIFSASNSTAQDFYVTAGVRTSVIGWKSTPNFAPFPTALGLMWDFTPAVGYEAGLSRTISIGRFTFEPELKYCRNTVNQNIHLLNRQLETLSSTTFILNNNVVEVLIPLKETIRINHHTIRVVLGPFGQFRKNETFRTEIGQGSDPIIENERFAYGLVTGLETGIKKMSVRLQSQFARTVFGSWDTGYKGYTLSINLRYKIGPVFKSKN